MKRLKARDKAVGIKIRKSSILNGGWETLRRGWREAENEIRKNYPQHEVRDISIEPVDGDSYLFTFHLATIEEPDGGVISVSLDLDDQVCIVEKWRCHAASSNEGRARTACPK